MCSSQNKYLHPSIAEHQRLRIIVKTLNRSNDNIRTVLQLNKAFANKRSRLRLEKLTRWSSCYFMLESVKRAYDKNIIEENDLECPISLQEIELYLQILKPAYEFSIVLQSNESTIGDV
jgi:hypothetical protein